MAASGGMNATPEVAVASPEEIGLGAVDYPAKDVVNAGDRKLEATEGDDRDNHEDGADVNPPGAKVDRSEQEEQEAEPEYEDASASDESRPHQLMPIRAPVSEDVEEYAGEDGEESFASGESFDSALERIAGSSTASFDTAASPKGMPDGFMSLGPVQQGALIKLNEMMSGVSSLDTTVLENKSEEEFKTQVAHIAESKQLSADDTLVQDIVNVLLPLVRGQALSSNGSVKSEEESETARVMPKAMPTADDKQSSGSSGSDNDEDNEDAENGVASTGESAVDDSETEEKGDETSMPVAKLTTEDSDKDSEDEVNQEEPKAVHEKEHHPNENERRVDSPSAQGLRVLLAEEQVGAAGDEHQHSPTKEEPEAHSESAREGDEVQVDEIEIQAPAVAEGRPEKDAEVSGAAGEEDEGVGEENDVEELREVVNIEKDDEEGAKDYGEPEKQDMEHEEPEKQDAEHGEPEKHDAEHGEPEKHDAEHGEPEKQYAEHGEPEKQYAEHVEPYAEHGEPGKQDAENAEHGEPEKQDAENEHKEPEKQDAENEHKEPEKQDAENEHKEPEKQDAENEHKEPEKQDAENEHKDPEKQDAGIEHKEPEKQEEEHGEPEKQKQHREESRRDTKDETQADVVTDGETEEAEDTVQDLSPALIPELRRSNDDEADGIDTSENVPETDSDDEADADESPVDRSEALQAFVRASAAATETPLLGSAGPSLPARPTGAGRSLPSLDSAPRSVQSSQNPTATSQSAPAVESAQANGEPNDENQETREKLQLIRVKFLRLAHRLGQTAHNVVVAQVLYRLGLAEQLRGGRSSSRNTAFSFDRASAIAEEQEAAGREELDFTCTIMVLGKTGVGKSATINSLFDEVKTETNAFTFATKKVQEITGMVHGIKLRVIDTPGLLPAVADQRHNEKIMSSVKRFIKKSPPDIVLYFDRLDMQSRDYGDLPLLRTITDTFGAAIWFNAIVVLTHASSAPPDGPNGVPLSYEMFLAQRSHVVQQTIRQAAGDMRLMNPVSLVENHPACRTNRAGERVLPNGQIWKPQLLLLCFASKILAEANSLLKLQESTPGKPFGMRSKVPPLPFLLSSLLQSRAPLKLPDENIGDDDETDEDIEEDDESDDEEEYDNLPPFRRLTREELDQLDKKNRDSYFEELHLREKLFQKKQWKEELRRRKEFKRRASSLSREDYQAPMDDGYDDENGKSAAVPVALPDMALPPSFDSDNPTHRYRYLETASQWLVRPVLETHGWDHDSGYDGLNLEKVFVVANKIPASVSGQITKDKKEANVTMECAASMKHKEGVVSQAGFDVQTVGKDLSYTLRSETRFSNFKKNKTIAGLALTMLGDTLAYGMKLEDRLMLGKRLKVVVNGGALTGKGDVAYGGTVEISLRDKDFPIGRTLSTLGFSVMNWHGDLAVGGNLQSQFMVGRTMVVARGNLNNRGAGQITIKCSSSEQLQMALVGVIPVIRALIGHRLFGNSQQV